MPDGRGRLAGLRGAPLSWPAAGALCPLTPGCLLAGLLAVVPPAAAEPPAAAPVAAAAPESLVEPGLQVRPLRPRGIQVLVTPQAGDTWASLARRVTGREAHGVLVRGKAGESRPEPGKRYEVPFELLSPQRQQEAVAALLPRDRCGDGVWLHRPSPQFPADASFEDLAAWFAAGPTGSASLEAALRAPAQQGAKVLELPCVGIAPWLAEARGCCAGLTEAQEEDREEVAAVEGGVTDLLLEPAPAPARQRERGPGGPPRPVDLLPGAAGPLPGRAREPAARPSGLTADLRYGKDAQGGYAAYRLRAGEAIYSGVIVRFTGRVHAREVNEVLPVIAERSGIRSFQELPVGYEVRIPLELLAPEYLPPEDARRREFERHQAEVASFRNQEVAEGLEGVVVVLDAGHGGKDPGATAKGVHEADYVFDILCRVKRELETKTRARVLPVVESRQLGWAPRDRKRLPHGGATHVRTTPAYELIDPVVGVNLRWYLANSHYRRQVEKGTEPTRVVFLSVHADSLHPTVRGAMVYVPGADYTAGRHGRRGPEYDRRQEVREAQFFELPERERKRAEGLSRELARRLISVMAERGIEVHAEKPIRDSVLRGGRSWLPAVLRSNRIPVRLLLEVCNLNHEDDNRLLESPAYRQAIAEAYTTALLGYFGSGSGAVARKGG